MSFLLQQRAARSQPGSPLSTSTGGLQEETPGTEGLWHGRGCAHCCGGARSSEGSSRGWWLLPGTVRAVPAGEAASGFCV